MCRDYRGQRGNCLCYCTCLKPACGIAGTFLQAQEHENLDERKQYPLNFYCFCSIAQAVKGDHQAWFKTQFLRQFIGGCVFKPAGPNRN
jgi:hypothetical protein